MVLACALAFVPKVGIFVGIGEALCLRLPAPSASAGPAASVLIPPSASRGAKGVGDAKRGLADELLDKKQAAAPRHSRMAARSRASGRSDRRADRAGNRRCPGGRTNTAEARERTDVVLGEICPVIARPFRIYGLSGERYALNGGGEPTQPKSARTRKNGHF